MKLSTFFYSLIILTAITLSSCVAVNPNQGAKMDETTLRDRVTVEWEARLTNAWLTIYELTTKEYKQGHSSALFGSKSNATPINYKIKSIVIDPENKSAEVKVDYTIQHMTFEFAFVSVETWIWEYGNWYLKLKE